MGTTWSRLEWKYCPSWLKDMLESLGARIATDSDSLMWYFREYSHLEGDVEKILSYSKDNPLQHRTFYEETELTDNEWRLLKLGQRVKAAVAIRDRTGCRLLEAKHLMDKAAPLELYPPKDVPSQL